MEARMKQEDAEGEAACMDLHYTEWYSDYYF